MDWEALKKVVILFLLISATLPSESFAGDRKLMAKAEEKDSPTKSLEKPTADAVHPRVLMVKTNDYGTYDPSPTLDKPPYKLIPN